MRLMRDMIVYCSERMARYNPINVSGYHISEAGATSVQELAFTLANGIAYVEEVTRAGTPVDAFASRLAFYFVAQQDFFEEVAKFRAARRMWSRIVLDRFHGQPKSAMLRFHTQTGGATLTAQQPENNIVRTALEALAAVLGGTQSLHTNGFDEALALPTERAARIALRTQQIIGYESGVVDTVDPLGGSYFVETMTNEIEQRAWEYIDKIEGMGGAVQAIEAGFYQDEIAEAAYKISRGIEDGTRIIVGVNKFVTDEVDDVEILKVDPESEQRQLERLRRFKETRDAATTESRLADLREAAAGDGNLLYPIKDALRDGASIGEVCGAMRDVFGEYQGGAFF